jgi:hypothetical protein
MERHGGAPSAFRKSIVLTGVARQHGTRSRAGEEELRRLRTSEVKALAIDLLRVECERRGIPTADDTTRGRDGTARRLKKEELKRALVDWIQGQAGYGVS